MLPKTWGRWEVITCYSFCRELGLVSRQLDIIDYGGSRIYGLAPRYRLQVCATQTIMQGLTLVMDPLRLDLCLWMWVENKWSVVRGSVLVVKIHTLPSRLVHHDFIHFFFSIFWCWHCATKTPLREEHEIAEVRFTLTLLRLWLESRNTFIGWIYFLSYNNHQVYWNICLRDSAHIALIYFDTYMSGTMMNQGTIVGWIGDTPCQTRRLMYNGTNYTVTCIVV